ncbi:MAG: bifunctional homocysteine S-methyltransferase/methylenetetrahydrofolate reductase [Vicinamibacterales bacterium]
MAVRARGDLTGVPLQPFLEAIDQRVLVCDGAMGTLLYAKGVFINRCFDALNLTQPALVAGVHADYLKAGADLIETNTFGANRIKLASFGLGDKVQSINAEGVRIARDASRGRAYVAGAIGPLGIRIEPWGRVGVDEAQAYFREQAEALAAAGVDLVIIETFRDLNEIRAAVAAVRSVCALPVVAQMTTEEDGSSLDGTPPEEFAPALVETGADVIGLNCSVGPAPLLESIERMAGVTRARLSAQPNAGKPRDIEGRTIYLSSPEYMASYARRFIQKGVRLVGGCCGTTPEHIRQIKDAVRRLSPPGQTRLGVAPVAPAAAVAGHPAASAPVPRGLKSRLAHELERGAFIVLAELEPPRGHDCATLIDRARTLKIRGVDAINVPDTPRVRAATSALATAILIEQRAGVETLLHYTCRDRNLLGMQSDLLGAHAMGLRNLLITTGNPPIVGDYPQATGVFDVDSIGLANVVTRLNQGLDVGGASVGSPTSFHLGVAVSPTALDLDLEVKRFAYKAEAGAEFAVTQAIFEVEALKAFLARTGEHRVPIVAGIWVFESLRDAEYMANEVPGVRVPAGLVDRMRLADEEGRAPAEGIAIARELVAAVRPLVSGVQIGTAGRQFSSILGVLEAME